MTFPLILSGLCLGALLVAAMIYDADAHRIPNRLVLIGIVLGLLLQLLLPHGDGLFAPAHAGSIGLVQALAGFGVGLGIMSPFYLLRIMGAGDVKLVAVTGLFLGPQGVLAAVLLTFLAGGVLALCVALYRGVLTRTMTNIRFLLTHSMVQSSAGGSARIELYAPSAGKLPYAFAIAGGTVFHVAMTLRGTPLF